MEVFDDNGTSSNGELPEEPNPDDCCGEGCSPCVWDVYREKLQRHLAKAGTEESSDSELTGLSKLEFSSCTLTKISRQTDDTAIYRFQSKGKFKILPGQHLELKIPDSDASGEDILRKYSPINWGANCFDVIIKRYPQGKVSKFLEAVEIQTDLLWRGPYGNFHYTKGKQDFLLVLCMGTGIAPMIPIVRKIINDESEETVIKLFCGASTLENRLLLTELKEMAAFWNFSFVHYVTSPEGDIPWGEKVERGRFTEVDIRKVLTRPQNSFALVCGTDAFCNDMKNILNEIGVEYYCF